MQGICDAFLAWYAPESPTMTKISTGSCLSRRGLPALSLNRACICCSLRRRRRRRTLGVFFSDVSCVSHSRYTLDSSWSLVACATISKAQSRGSWQGGPPTPNDQNEPHMETHFHVAILSPRTPSRTKPPGAVWRCSPITPPWPRRPIGM